MCQGWCVSLVAGLDWTVSYRAQLHVPRAPRPRHVVTWPGNYHPISAHLSQTQQTFKLGTGSIFIISLIQTRERMMISNNSISPNNDQFEFWCHGLMQILVLLPSSQWWGDVTSSPDTMLRFYLHKWKLNCNLIKQYKHHSDSTTWDCNCRRFTDYFLDIWYYSKWPCSPGLGAVVPGGPGQRHAVQAAPVEDLVLRHAVAEVAAGRPALHDGDPRLQVECEHGGHQHQAGPGHALWCPHDARSLTAASASLLLMASHPSHVISQVMTPSLITPRRQSSTFLWKLEKNSL